MSSNAALSLASSKTACSPSQIPPPFQTHTGPSPATESYGQRRAGGSCGFGAGSSTRSTSSTPRNNQSLRKQHKDQRRLKLADEDAAAECAAMQSTSSRKRRTSITHLMSFTLPPRPQHHPPHYFGRNFKRNPTWGLGSGYHAADKARYIHANYRFIVKPDGDYRAQAVDSDVHLDWVNVLQILVSAQSQASNCPICLSTPVAPRMAKCGHIFCLPCLIRYMHSTDDTNALVEKKARWKKCPICYDNMYISETRPVRWFTGQEGERPHKGGDVVLRLIVRRPGSTLALPRDGADNLESMDDIPWYFAAEVMDYARIMKGSEDYMTEQYQDEIEELYQQEKEDELMFGEDAEWTKRAVSSIEEAVERVRGIGNPPRAPKQPAQRKPRRPQNGYPTDTEDIPKFPIFHFAKRSGQSSARATVVTQYERSGSSVDVSRRDNQAHSNEEILTETVPSATSTSPIVSRSQSAAPSVPSINSRTSSYSRNPSTRGAQNIHSDSPFFFYEALLHFYLSPLDIRILKAAFGDYSSFPTTILPRIERVSTGHVIDDELRRRAKYLAHLPQGCEVAFLECNWTDIVSPHIVNAFAPEIERRRRKNQERDVHEEKERVRAEKEEDDKRWATARRRRPSLGHDVGSGAEFQPLPKTSTVDFTSPSSSPPWSSSRGQQGSAFASLASPSTSPVTAKTVWGTHIVASSTPPMPALEEDNVPENDGWLQDWEADLLREEDLVTQVEATSLEAGSSKQEATPTAGKKKKGKKITLMSTSARRGA